MRITPLALVLLSTPVLADPPACKKTSSCFMLCTQDDANNESCGKGDGVSAADCRRDLGVMRTRSPTTSYYCRPHTAADDPAPAPRTSMPRPSH